MRAFVVAMASLSGFLAATAAYGWQGAEITQEERQVQKKTIETVLKAHTESLMALPGVVGTALSECAGQPCIKVFVAKKTLSLLEAIPSVIEGYPVAVQETGELRAIKPQ